MSRHEETSLPHSIESEKAVLGGAMLTNGAALAECEHLGLKPSDFYREAHRRLYEHFLWRIQKQRSFDMVAVVEDLASKPRNIQDQLGGLTYVSGLADDVPSTENMPHFARVIIERAVSRRVIQIGLGMAAKARNGVEVDALIADAERDLQALAGSTNGPGDGEWITGFEMAERTIARLKARQKARLAGEVIGMLWGIDDVDNDPGLPSLRPKKFYLVAARPAMGKTSFALELLRTVLESGQSVGVQSLEMEEDSLADKLIGLQADYSTANLRDGAIEDADWPDIFTACDAMSEWSIYLDTVPDRTITQVRSRFRQLAVRLKREGKPLGLIIVDYAQLLRADGNSMEEKMAEVSRGLLAMAKELDVPVVALAQLNRACEQRMNKRPIMSDLRNSGQFEQDANAILFLYRHEVYHGDEDPACRGLAEVIKAKVRGGQIGTIHTRWDGRVQRFGSGAANNVHHLDQQSA